MSRILYQCEINNRMPADAQTIRLRETDDVPPQLVLEVQLGAAAPDVWFRAVRLIVSIPTGPNVGIESD